MLGNDAVTIFYGCAVRRTPAECKRYWALDQGGAAKTCSKGTSANPRLEDNGWQRTGVHFYVYPDATKNQIFVGTEKEYAAYRRLYPNGGPTLAQQRATDMASYNKQDAAMQMYTARDLADPYYFWDSFDGLGWR
jgi:hypothetical protein